MLHCTVQCICIDVSSDLLRSFKVIEKNIRQIICNKRCEYLLSFPRQWSKMTNFIFTRTCSIAIMVSARKLINCDEKSLTMRKTVLTQITSVTDGRTDRQTTELLPKRFAVKTASRTIKQSKWFSQYEADGVSLYSPNPTDPFFQVRRGLKLART